MARVRQNFFSGTLSSQLSVGATTLQSSALSSFPAVTGSDVAYLVIDPAGSTPEIVKVTAHTASSTSATIVRGQDSTTDRTWAAGTTVIQAPIASDVDASTLAADAAFTGSYAARTSFDVSAYGAVGDGATDDTAAIQAAIDAAAAVGGGTVVFPSRGGTYRATTLTLADGVKLVSADAAFGYLPASVGGVTIKASDTSGYLIDTPTGGATGAAVVGISLSGNTNKPAGIRFKNGSSWCAVKRVNFNSFQDAAVLTEAGTVACVFEDLLAVNCLLDHTRSQVDGVFDIEGTDHFFSRCEVSGSLSALTDSNMYVNAWVIRGDDCFIESCVGEYADRGWYIASGATYNRFSLCRGDRNFANDWEIQGNNNTFVGCAAVEGAKETANTYSGFKFGLVQGNIVMGCRTAHATNRYKYAFEDAANSSSWAARNYVIGCYFLGYTTAQTSTVAFLGTSIQVPPASIRPADGTTSIDVTGADVVYLGSYTSATTVTAFTGGVNGQHLYLIGDADVTIQNNASIKTSTGANRTLTGSVAYHYVYYNGVWYEVATA